jgi:hypothetical protein
MIKCGKKENRCSALATLLTPDRHHYVTIPQTAQGHLNDYIIHLLEGYETNRPDRAIVPRFTIIESLQRDNTTFLFEIAYDRLPGLLIPHWWSSLARCNRYNHRAFQMYLPILQTMLYLSSLPTKTTCYTNTKRGIVEEGGGGERM